MPLSLVGPYTHETFVAQRIVMFLLLALLRGIALALQ